MDDVNCQFLIPSKRGKEHFGMCALTKKICPYVRFCASTRKIVNAYIYIIQGCEIERNKDNYLKEE